MSTETEPLQGLLNILQDEQESILKLLECSRQKVNCLTHGREYELPEILKQEGVLVSEIGEHEERRKTQVGFIAQQLGEDLDDQASILKIVAYLPDERWKKKLGIARERLTAKIDQLQRSNRKVNSLLKQKMKYTDMMLDLFLVPDTMLNSSYDRKGKREQGDIVRAGFLDVYI